MLCIQNETEECDRMNKYEKNPEKYAMGEDMQTTRHHPHYSDNKSARANYLLGLKYAEEHHLSRLWLAKSIGQLANLTHKEVYKKAAKIAYAEYRKRKR